MSRTQLDARSLRFAAWVTSAVLAAVLATGSWELAAAQTLVFAAGAFAGLRRAPYGLVFRYAVRPFLGPPVETEDEAPPRFAQLVGFVFGVAGTVGYGVGPAALGVAAIALALAAALLNAAFGLCLGCLCYLRLRLWVPPVARMFGQ